MASALTSIAESVAAAVTATMAAIVTRKQEQLSTTNVTVFTCKNFSENSYASSKTTVEN